MPGKRILQQLLEKHCCLSLLQWELGLQWEIRAGFSVTAAHSSLNRLQLLLLQEEPSSTAIRESASGNTAWVSQNELIALFL